MNYHVYADDIHFLPISFDSFSILSNAVSDISSWVSSWRVFLDHSKSELIASHPPRMYPSLLSFPLSDSVRNLRIIF